MPYVGAQVLVAGIAGGILHIGLFFVPALVVLAVGSMELQREQPGPYRDQPARQGALTWQLQAARPGPLGELAQQLLICSQEPGAVLAWPLSPQSLVSLLVRSYTV